MQVGRLTKRKSVALIAVSAAALLTCAMWWRGESLSKGAPILPRRLEPKSSSDGRGTSAAVPVETFRGTVNNRVAGVQEPTGDLRHFFELLQVSPTTSWQELSDSERQALIGKAISLLANLDTRERLELLRTLWRLRARHPELSASLASFHRSLFRPGGTFAGETEALNLIALQADGPARQYFLERLTGLSDNDVWARYDDPMHLLAAEGGIRAGDPLASYLMTRITREGALIDLIHISPVLVKSKDEGLMQSLRQQCLNADPGWERSIGKGLGAALIAHDPSFLTTSATEWSRYTPRMRENVLLGLQGGAGNLSLDVDRVLTVQKDSVAELLTFALRDEDPGVRAQAAKVLSRRSFLRNATLDAELQRIAQFDVNKGVQRVAQSVLTPQ